MTAHRHEVVLAALPPGAARVEIVGHGPLAQALREQLSSPLSIGVERPAAIVETTGDAEAIREALARVDDLGTVVLAGPPPGAGVALDLYADLHVRGLTLVGTLGR
jgi:hypothetical protein